MWKIFSINFEIYELGLYSLEDSWEILKNLFLKPRVFKLWEIWKKDLVKRMVLKTEFADQFEKPARENGILVKKPTLVRLIFFKK